MNFEEITRKVAAVAYETGAFIRQERRRFSYDSVEFKGESNLVSYVDKESERKITTGLKKILPEAGFITEEETTEQGQKEFTWIIDPLDGTTNFVHGIPNYCVSIGLMHEGKIIAGVVYEVANDECFYAWKNGGAYLNKQRIRVSQAAAFSDCILATGFPYFEFERLEEYLKILHQLMESTQGLRRMGSAAADMAYVACGRYGGYFEYNLNSYDIAGGVILVQEAGGIVTDFRGGDDYIFGREIVAGGSVQSQLLEVIQRYW
ncbi:inositol monophosphatase family protein [Ekhidna sp. To15]|uniref:inositol monophosphatase family protein n=1 Tax=Ekhidna sp. To15 TaxID=3395267 RepID=UPI003F51E354